ncbi:GFA family protein [Novosphingobium sp.]|uniref:GFA family protein n=1 Tax=Novosphingobium sp. TaxID=1874826 RepID=UPI0025E2F9C5|nr:GFA family protein [Novosphingobium sp.]
MHAQCQCGLLSAEVSASSGAISACHCFDCQRRSGSPFGVIAYFEAGQVALDGEATTYTRLTDSGATFTTGFCATCGSTVWARADKHPSMIGVPVGAFADWSFPPPMRSVFEASRHSWVEMPSDIPRFPRGRN